MRKLVTVTLDRKGELISRRFHREDADRTIGEMAGSLVEQSWESIEAALKEVDKRDGRLYGDGGETASA